MNVLLLTQIVPYPPDSGPKVKTHNVIKYLAERHGVSLASFVRSAQERTWANALKEYCAGVYTVPIHRSPLRDARHVTASLISDLPFLVMRDRVIAMRRLVRDLLHREHFDVIHADQLTMAQYATPASGERTILDEHNAVWTIVRRLSSGTRWGPRRLLMELEWRKLRRYEGTLCRHFDHTLAVTEEDRRALEHAAGRPCGITVVPIGVDTADLALVPRQAAARDVISIATMFYPPNSEGVLWFAREVFPTLVAHSPQTRFLVVGARPPREVEHLMRVNPNIVVTGYVADVQPFIAQSAVLVVPVRSGSGMRVKILEAFARGIPVVSTTVGCEGIRAEHEQHLLLADQPAAFARAVLRILEDRAFADAMVVRARQFVEERYDWRVVCQPLAEVYAGLERPQRSVPRAADANTAWRQDGHLPMTGKEQ